MHSERNPTEKQWKCAAKLCIDACDYVIQVHVATLVE